MGRETKENDEHDGVIGDPADEEPAHDEEGHLQRSLGGLAHPTLTIRLGLRQTRRNLGGLEAATTLCKRKGQLDSSGQFLNSAKFRVGNIFRKIGLNCVDCSH